MIERPLHPWLGIANPLPNATCTSSSTNDSNTNIPLVLNLVCCNTMCEKV
jgi:hypothetical protein